MKFVRTAGAAALVSVWTMSVAPQALAGAKDWWLDLSAAAMFDDRVTVDEDDSSATSDAAVVLELDAGYKLVNESDTRVEIGYDFYQSIYAERTDFNWQEHHPTISAWTKLGGVKLGLSYGYTNALLDGDFYYEQHAVTPSIAAYLSDDVQLILSYRYYDKNYNPADDARDATGHQPNADLYFYFGENKKAYVQLGAGYTDEETKGEIVSTLIGPVPTDPYDYSGFVGRAAVQVPIDPFGLPGRFKISYSYQMRDYDDPTSLFPATLPPPAGSPTRHDNRQTIRAYADAEIADDLKLYVDYRFMDRGSNLPSADYNKNVVSLGLKFEL